MPNNIKGNKEQELVPQKESLFEMRSASQELINEAHANIEDMYKVEEQDALERREYHNVEHTKGVEDKAEKILNTMREADPSIGITDRDIVLARLIASHHDIDQSQKEPRRESETVGGNEFEKELRVRYTKQIEKNSAGVLLGRMQQINEREQKEIFTTQDMETAKKAIVATIPGFSGKTVTQPELNAFVEESLKRQAELEEKGEAGSLEEERKKYMLVLTVALADLGAMMDGGEEFLRDGDRVFREDNIDIAKTLDKHEGLSSEQKEFICKRVKDWYKMQIGFVEGRKEIFEQQILLFPEHVRDHVRNLFKFDESIQAAKKRLEILEEREKNGDKPSFEEMVEGVGYTLSR